MIDVSKLLPLCQPSVAKRAMEALMAEDKPDTMLVGRLGRIGFVVTFDGSGDCEASISLPDERPTMRHARAFFRQWGRPIPMQPPLSILGGKGLHWVISRGTRH